MTPAARLQATIESLNEIEEGVGPANRFVSQYLRKRRYIGAKDRTAIRNNVFSIIRGQFRLDFQIRNAGGHPSPRCRTIANTLLGGNSLDEIALLYIGNRCSPSKLTEPEKLLLTLIKVLKVPL